MVLNILTPIRFHFAGELPKAGKILSILAILVQTFSCVSLDFDNPNDPRNGGGGSSGDIPSSSSVVASSSSAAPSSSSVALSSSSATPSSSSAAPSSSGVALSSSSATPSSSAGSGKCAEFDPIDFFCYEGEVYEKCGDKEYDPSTHICSNNAPIQALCGGVQYNPLMQKCEGNVFLVKCGTDFYNPSSQFCLGEAIYNKCGGEEYDPFSSTQYCRDGVALTAYGSVSQGSRTYKTVVIGTQTWMAENLNNNASGSLCYDNCAKYGRLYDWATAMGIDASYNNSLWNGSDAKHQGICPAGWHLPSDGEWTTLTNFVGASTAGKKLKATSGWNNNGNGTDDFGFAALPGGHGGSDGLFGSAGYGGLWWSSTEGNAYYAYSRGMYCNYEGVSRYDGYKAHLFSVRCLQDSAP